MTADLNIYITMYAFETEYSLDGKQSSQECLRTIHWYASSVKSLIWITHTNGGQFGWETTGLIQHGDIVLSV